MALVLSNNTTPKPEGAGVRAGSEPFPKAPVDTTNNSPATDPGATSPGDIAPPSIFRGTKA